MSASSPIRIFSILTAIAFMCILVGIGIRLLSPEKSLLPDSSNPNAQLDSAHPTNLPALSRPSQSEPVHVDPISTPPTEAAKWTGGRPPLRYALRVGEGALVSQAEKLGEARLADEYSPRDDDYDFPAIHVSENGEVSMQIPDAALPSRSSKRALFMGQGPRVKDGHLVALRYDVFRWSTGELVESHWPGGEEGLGYVVGGDNPAALPAYLEKALLGRPLGSRVQVILRQGTEDLPDSFDPLDAYVVMIDIDAPADIHREAVPPDLPDLPDV